MSFPKTLAAAGASAFTVIGAGDEATEAGFILSEEMLNKIEDMLSPDASSLRQQLISLTAERDRYKQEAEDYGSATSDPEETYKPEDDFPSKPVLKNSMDRYAEQMGVTRV